MTIRQSLLSGLVAGLTLVLAAPALAGPSGLWNTENGDAQVEVAPCGQKLCGELVWLKEPLDEQGRAKLDRNNPDESLQGQPIVGLQIVWDMEPKGDGKVWEGGHVYDPESGKTYRARITLKGDNELDLRGYIGRPMFGRTSTWTRADGPAGD